MVMAQVVEFTATAWSQWEMDIPDSKMITALERVRFILKLMFLIGGMRL